MVPSRSSSSRPSTIAPIEHRKNGAAVRTVPSARRQSGDMKTSSVGMFGTNSTPSAFTVDPPSHTVSGRQAEHDVGARALVADPVEGDAR